MDGMVPDSYHLGWADGLNSIFWVGSGVYEKMKYLTIVTFLLLIHISAAIINAAEYTSGYNFQPNEADFIEISSAGFEESLAHGKKD